MSEPGKNFFSAAQHIFSAENIPLKDRGFSFQLTDILHNAFRAACVPANNCDIRTFSRERSRKDSADNAVAAGPFNF